MKFVIPLHPEGLVKDPGDGRYCVSTSNKKSSEKTLQSLLDGSSGPGYHEILIDLDVDTKIEESPLVIITERQFDSLYMMIRFEIFCCDTWSHCL